MLFVAVVVVFTKSRLPFPRKIGPHDLLRSLSTWADLCFYDSKRQLFCSSPVSERQLLIQTSGLAEMLAFWPSAQYKCWSTKHCLSLYIKTQQKQKKHTQTKSYTNKQANKTPNKSELAHLSKNVFLFLSKARQTIYIFHFSKYATSCSIPLQCILTCFVHLWQSLFYIRDKNYFW